jgi:transcriptional regulator with XRE-family HTH domain
MKCDQAAPLPFNRRVAHQIGSALRRLRERRGAKQYRVAEFADITKGMLSAYETGRQCPSLPTLVRLLRVLDCTAEEFGRYIGPWGCVRGSRQAS